MIQQKETRENEKKIDRTHLWVVAFTAVAHTYTPNQSENSMSNQSIIRVGDRVRPSKRNLYSITSSDYIPWGDTVVVSEVTPSYFCILGRRGVFSRNDFEKVAKPVPTEKSAESNGVLSTQSRKTLKKRKERELGADLEWHDSHLCYKGTGQRIPNSPYVPKSKPATTSQSRWR